MKKILFSISLFLVMCNVLIAQSKIKAIKAGKLIDVVSGTVLYNQIILLDSNKIMEVGPSVTIPANARVDGLSYTSF